MAPIHPDITLPYGTLPKDFVDLGTVFGPFFLAQCFNWALYGVLCLQVYIYWLRFPKDMTYIKWLVGSVFIVDTFSIALVTHAAWRVLVSYWGDINILHNLDWTWASVPVSSGVVSSMVQLFFVYRIRKLSQQFVMPFIIVLVIIAQCAFSFQTGVIAYQSKNFHYIRDLIPAFWLGGSMLADILISVTLARILWNGRTGFTDTDGVIMRLIRLTVEAAAVPTIAAAIKLALIYSAHDNKHLVFCVVLARLYSNSLLAMLNCRDPLFGGGHSPNTLAGAARLSATTSTNGSFLSKIAEKFSSKASSRASLDSREQAVSLDHTYGDKIQVHKAMTRSHDIDLDACIAGVELDYCRNSSTTVNSTLKPVSFAPSEYSPTSPTFPNYGQQLTVDSTGATYETKSQLTPTFAPDGSRLGSKSPFAQQQVLPRPVLAKPATSYSGGRLPFD